MTDPIAKKYKTTVLNHFDLKDVFFFVHMNVFNL